MAKLTCPKNSPVVLATVELIKTDLQIQVQEGEGLFLQVDSGTSFNKTETILRYLARAAPKVGLYGETAAQRSEVDHWIQFSSRLTHSAALLLKELDQALAPVTYLVGHTVTLADLCVWASLYGCSQLQTSLGNGTSGVNVLRYYQFLCAHPALRKIQDLVPAAQPKQVSKKEAIKRTPKEEGKFADLPGAEMGQVVVRFPPEASGYLHVGHAKAALLNQFYQQSFQGKLILRFDDTNPEKENAHFEEVILKDVELLGIKPDLFTRTSDHFDRLLAFCEEVIRKGLAYVDDTDGETMKKQREERTESANRNNSVDKNLFLWEEMKSGTEKGFTCCVRAKINMQSDNGCLRDPTIYRCKREPHVVTGDKYKAYPTYDFACPIVDSIEKVTHALRTIEYHDRDEQYYWFIDALGLRKPYLWEYSRLNLQHTVMSKRKLTWFVKEGLVEGWDDPRFPTVRGVLRRGMTVEGMKEFVIAQGGSRSVNVMGWDKIWAFNKKVIDPVAPRYTAIPKHGAVLVNVKDVTEGNKQVPVHPKDGSLGSKTVWYGPKVWIDGADAACLTQGEKVTFINWGNLIIDQINKCDSEVVSITASPALDDMDYKKTQKLTWLADASGGPFTPTVCVTFEPLITKAVLDKNDDFQKFINYNSRKSEVVLGDPELRHLKKGDIIQLQRRGFFICDQPYAPVSPYTGCESPCVLFNIPDGHTKEMPTSGSKYKDMAPSEVTSSKAVSQEKTTVKTPDGDELEENIMKQGDIVRELKCAKAPKAEVDQEVKKLLDLKKAYKDKTGKDWKPAQEGKQEPAKEGAVKGKQEPAKEGAVKGKQEPAKEGAVKGKQEPAKGKKQAAKGKQEVVEKESKVQQMSSTTMSSGGTDLNDRIVKQGDLVRQLKTAKAPKAEIDVAVKQLLDLKAEYEKTSGQKWPPGAGSENTKAASENNKPEPKAKETKDQGHTREVKKVTRLGLEAKKEENLPEWYSQVITKAELVEYYDVSGCYVFRPGSYAIWENISKWFDAKIKEIGFDNCYFPLFVSQSALEKEKEHVEDFAPEVAWVTRSGQTDLAEPIAIRPTSETVMYPSYARWVQSYRDLPIKLNQWCSVVRWEFKHPQPFLRTREFLWQEGHSAYATYKEAEEEVYYIIDLYEEIYENLLAIPVIKGRKTQKEKFAGADFTTTVEVYIGASGRGIQAATSHHLGQNFSKMFDISFEDPETREKQFAYQNSWAITTRSIGIIVMVHGDNKGLVMPPRIAKTQVIIVPCGITASLSDADKQHLYDECKKLCQAFKDGGVKSEVDYRDYYSPGWKFNHWELKGVPIRVELGPKDLEAQQFVAVRRDTGGKATHQLSEAVSVVKDLLENMHTDMFNKAKAERDAHLTICHDFESFCTHLDKKHLVMSPYCGAIPCEENIKKISARDAVVEEGAPAMGAKGLCIPFKQPCELKATDTCINPGCTNPPKYYTVFGRSY